MDKPMFYYVFNRYLEKNYRQFEDKKIDINVLRSFVRDFYDQNSIENDDKAFAQLPKEIQTALIDIAVKTLPQFDFKDYIVYLQNNQVQAYTIPKMNETIKYFKESSKFRAEIARNPTLRNQYDKIIIELYNSPFIFEKCKMYKGSDIDIIDGDSEDVPFEERYATAEEAKAAEPDAYRAMVEKHINSILSRYRIGKGEGRRDNTIYSIKIVNEKSNEGRIIDSIKLQEATNIDETIIEEDINTAAPIVKKLVDYSAKHFNGLSIISMYKTIMNYRIATDHHLKPGDMKFEKFMNYLLASDNIIFYDIVGKRFLPKVVDDFEEKEVRDALEQVFDAMQFNANIRYFDELTMLLKLFQITQLRHKYLFDKFRDEIILNFSSRFYRGKIDVESEYYKFIDIACNTINQYSANITTVQQLIAVLTMSNYKVWNVSSVNRLNLALKHLNLFKVDYSSAVFDIMKTVNGIDIASAVNRMNSINKHTTLNRYAIEELMEMIPQEYDMHYYELSLLINKYYIFKNDTKDTFDFNKFKSDMEFLGVTTNFEEIDLDPNGFIQQFGDLPIIIPSHLIVKRKDVEESISQKKIVAEIFEQNRYNALIATTKNEYILINTTQRVINKFIIFKIVNGRIVCRVERLTYLY